MEFDEDLLKRLESEKLVLDEKVDRARYGYIVSRRDYYSHLIEEMEQFTVKMTKKIEHSNMLFGELIQVDMGGSSQVIYDKLWEMVEQVVKVDGSKMGRKGGVIGGGVKQFEVSMVEEEAKGQFKTPEKSNGSKSSGEDQQMVDKFYTLKNTEVWRHHYAEEKAAEKVFDITHCYSPKVAFT